MGPPGTFLPFHLASKICILSGVCSVCDIHPFHLASKFVSYQGCVVSAIFIRFILIRKFVSYQGCVVSAIFNERWIDLVNRLSRLSSSISRIGKIMF